MNVCAFLEPANVSSLPNQDPLFHYYIRHISVLLLLPLSGGTQHRVTPCAKKKRERPKECHVNKAERDGRAKKQHA